MTTQPTSATKLYKALVGKSDVALDPDSPLYVPLLGANPSKDPILRLFERIKRAESESVNLLTGFRGNGKSTQLRRLRKLLTDDGCTVILVDMQDYILFTKPIELADFLLSLSAALADSVRKVVGLDVLSLRYVERLTTFLRETKVEAENVDLGGDVAKISLKLKREASFKKRVQDALRAHVSQLVQQMTVFVSEVVDSIRKNTGDPDRKVVLLVDSLEQLRGFGADGDVVLASVVALFAGESASLSFPKLHVTYTVPPYLTTVAPNYGRGLGSNPVTTWPNVHVRTKDEVQDPEGLAVIRDVITRRCPEWHEVLLPAQLDRLAGSTGGDLRDLFRLVREAALILDMELSKDHAAKVTDKTLETVEQELRNELTPHATNDVDRLALIAATKTATLPDVSDAKTLARFLDSNWIMNYLNGEPWFDVHPLLMRTIDRHRQAQPRPTARS